MLYPYDHHRYHHCCCSGSLCHHAQDCPGPYEQGHHQLYADCKSLSCIFACISDMKGTLPGSFRDNTSERRKEGMPMQFLTNICIIPPICICPFFLLNSPSFLSAPPTCIFTPSLLLVAPP